MGWVVNATPRPLYPRERSGTHCIGGWLGPRARVDGCGKSFPHRDSIPGLRYPGPHIYIHGVHRDNLTGSSGGVS